MKKRGGEREKDEENKSAKNCFEFDCDSGERMLKRKYFHVFGGMLLLKVYK